MASKRSGTASPTLKESVVKPKKSGNLTLERLLSLSKSEAQSILSDLGSPSSPVRTDFKQAELLAQKLQAHHVDPKIPLKTLHTSITSAQLQMAAQDLTLAQQQAAGLFPSLAQATASLTASSTALSSLQRKMEQQTAENRQWTERLASLEAELRETHSALSAATSTADTSALGQGLGTDQALTLRLTGLKEEAGEDKQVLLEKVDEVLNTLPCNVSVSDAHRQGMSGSRSRAVILTFGSEDQRGAVLRCKARLSRKEETRGIGINEVLTPQQQHHVHALWDICHQARRAGRRATIRGCSLIIDGKLWTGPEQSLHCTAQSQLHQVGPVPDMPLPMHCHPSQQQTSCIRDSYAAMTAPINPIQQPQPHLQPQTQPQTQHQQHPAQLLWPNTPQYTTAPTPFRSQFSQPQPASQLHHHLLRPPVPSAQQ